MKNIILKFLPKFHKNFCCCKGITWKTLVQYKISYGNIQFIWTFTWNIWLAISYEWASKSPYHYDDVIMSAMASQITSLMIVYPIVYSGADQTKHQSSASPAFVRWIHPWPLNFPHKGPVTWKMFPFDNVIMLAYTMAVNDLTKKNTRITEKCFIWNINWR